MSGELNGVFFIGGIAAIGHNELCGECTTQFLALHFGVPLVSRHCCLPLRLVVTSSYNSPAIDGHWVMVMIHAPKKWIAGIMSGMIGHICYYLSRLLLKLLGRIENLESATTLASDIPHIGQFLS